MTQEEEINKLIELFNIFIKEWTGDNYTHLIDSDDNAGERFRNEIIAHDTALLTKIIKMCEGKKLYHIVGGDYNKAITDIIEGIKALSVSEKKV